jgi:hypothetical protein
MNSPEGVEPSISHNVNEVLVTITADADSEQPEITPSIMMAPECAVHWHPGIATQLAPRQHRQSGNESLGGRGTNLRYHYERCQWKARLPLVNSLQRRSNLATAGSESALWPDRPARDPLRAWSVVRVGEPLQVCSLH